MCLGMSAGEARAEGVPVDTVIPDCAELTLIVVDASDVRVSASEGSHINIQIPVRPEWSWVEVTAILKEEGTDNGKR